MTAPSFSNPTLHQKTSLRVIQEHLKLIAAPYNEAGLSGMIALRALPSSRYQLFGLDDLPAAGAWAVSQNSDQGQNVYVAPGLFACDTTGAGKDDDVIAQAYLFADADDGDQAARLLDHNHPLVGQQAFHVVTGTKPSMRLHAYWQLAQPVRDMSAWRQAQKALISEFQTDASIHNPSRIMRLAGTISWPSKDKRAKGYIPELVRLDRPGTPAPSVSMGTVLAYARPAPRSPVSHPSASTFGLVAELKAQEEQGTGWYTLMVRLAGLLARQGVSDQELMQVAEQITWKGYEVSETYNALKHCVDYFKEKDGQQQQAEDASSKYSLWRDGWSYVAATGEFVCDDGSPPLRKESWTDSHRHLFDLEPGRVGKLLWTQRWLEDEEATKLKSYCFRPEQPRITADGYLNDWRPSPAMQLAARGNPDGPAAIMFAELVRKLCREREDIAQMLEHWMARGLFKQTERVRYAVFLVSHTKGLGKGILCYILSELYGRHLSVNVNGLGGVVGRFQASLKGRMLVSVAETVDRGDNNRFSACEALKPLITEDFVTIEQKYRDAISVENYMRFVFSSNHLDGLPIDQNERRFLVINAASTKPFSSDFYADLSGLARTDEGLADIAAYLHERVGDPLPARAPQGDLMDAIEDLTPEWINELHERLDDKGLTDCAMASADLMAFKPEGLADQVALNALKRAGWRAIRASLGGHRGRVFLRGERENVTKRTFRHQI